MRRQTTKQPSGAAITASPRPASRARIRNGSAPSALPIRRAPARRHGRARLTGEIVLVIVLMGVEAEGARRLRPEKARVLGMLRHRLRHARTAHMPVEADDAVALRHDHVKIV